MPEQRERIEQALKGCAEAGVPETVDLWHEISERVSVEPRRERRFRLVPRTRVGWVFAALVMMLLTMGAYAGSKWVYSEFQNELPGGDAARLGEKLYLTQTMQEARVTVEWVYADTRFVVVGFTVEDLKDERKDYENDAELQPFLGGGSPDDLPSDLGGLTDESGKNFPMIDGTTFVSDGPFMLRGPVANTAVFKVPENLELGEKHRFHLEIPLQELPVFGQGAGVVRDEPDPLIGPFVFDFEVPVRSASVIEMDRKVEASGLTVTLDRVVQSPGRPQAIICFEPPNDKYEWMPVMDYGAAPDREGYLETRPVGGMKSGCWSVALPEYANNYSFTVDYIEGSPRTEPEKGDPEMPNTIRGPWKFTFEVPKQ